jgi:pullulanase
MTKYFLMATMLSGLFLRGLGQKGFANYLPYNGNDLGVTYTKQKTTFKVWSPSAEVIKLKLYPDGYKSRVKKEITMKKGEQHVFAATLHGNYKNVYYTYQIRIAGKWLQETTDPYAKAVGVNGKRGMVVDFAATNPANWHVDKSPNYGSNMKDAVLYELHVRDATIFTNAKHKGKFLGLTETGLKNANGQAVGLDHLKELGVTHVHLLPSYDFFTVDETIPNNPQYNWGYDPLNYNVPEGSYSTNPYDGNVRIKEFKQMVKALHDNGINVVMDVVYNHTMFTEASNFNQMVPGYYYRQKPDGSFSDASACGNETASDRTMYRKFMLESILHWANEYHIDGFRFDLMAIHDVTTMNLIATELRKIKPNAVIYGEGWNGGDSPLPEAERALKKHAYKMNDVAVFSDDIRDAQKGSVFEKNDSGFVSGKGLATATESIKMGLIGAGKHPDIDYNQVNYSKAPYTSKPQQMISYSECHDNHTLWDRLLNSVGYETEERRKQMQLLSLSIVLTGQGIPFIHAGQEFCRTKQGEENSYKSPNEINGIRWDRKMSFNDVYEKVKQLITIRKQHNAFRLGDAELVAKHVRIEDINERVIIMKITDAPNDSWKNIYVIYNGNNTEFVYDLPAAKKTTIQYQSFNGGGITGAQVMVPALQCIIITAE